MVVGFLKAALFLLPQQRVSHRSGMVVVVERHIARMDWLPRAYMLGAVVIPPRGLGGGVLVKTLVKPLVFKPPTIIFWVGEGMEMLWTAGGKWTEFMLVRSGTALEAQPMQILMSKTA